MPELMLTRKNILDNTLMDREIREGLPVDSYLQLAKTLQSRPEMISSAIMGRKPSTLLRLKLKGKRLEPRESEGIVRIFRVFLRAEDVLGSAASARKWLSEVNSALGGRTPLELTATEPGAREVENVLGRIEHGVFS